MCAIANNHKNVDRAENGFKINKNKTYNFQVLMYFSE